MSLLILVVDDEPDVEQLFRQQFRRDLRSGRFAMEFAQSAAAALERIAAAADRSLILILSDINMPGMSGLELSAARQEPASRRTDHHDHRLRRRGDQAQGAGTGRRGAAHQADRFRQPAQRNRSAGRKRRMTAQILVVDDEPDLEALIQQKFRHQIRDGTVAFLFARDGVDALGRAEGERRRSTWW